MKRGTIIIGGFIGIFPAGGVTWDYIQYIIGFKRLGFRVIYVEDTRLYPLYHIKNKDWNDSKHIVDHLSYVMRWYGLEESWIYRDEVTGESFGMPMADFKEACLGAEWFVNISCSTVMREEYASISNRILIDSDPMFTQMQLITEQSFTEGETNLDNLVGAHNHHFTFGENIGRRGCKIPDTKFNWKITRQPVVIDQWPVIKASTVAPYTTLMNWKAGKKLVFNGDTWGQKDLEFHKIENIPIRAPQSNFEIVVSKTGSHLSAEELSYFDDKRWKVKSPDDCAATADQYRKFIQNSKAELSVAKETYVKAATGWFSCRSACYLASGRPVITQNTGWSDNYPTGNGLFAFSSENEIYEAIASIESDYEYHSDAAREIAVSYFDSDLVLTDLFNQAKGTG